MLGLYQALRFNRSVATLKPPERHGGKDPTFQQLVHKLLLDVPLEIWSRNLEN